MPNNSHILNIKLDDSEYAALCSIKSVTSLPFTTIIKTLIRREADTQGLNVSETASLSVSNLKSPTEDKLQLQLKLLQAREDLRIAREARKEQARIAQEERKEQARIARANERKAEKQRELEEKRILKAIRKGDPYAGGLAQESELARAGRERSERKEQERAKQEAERAEELRQYSEYRAAQETLRAAWSEAYDNACNTRYRGPWNQARLDRALSLSNQVEIFVELEELEAAVSLGRAGPNGIDTLRQMEAKLRGMSKPYDSWELVVKYP